jgi:hypothetical protein
MTFGTNTNNLPSLPPRRSIDYRPRNLDTNAVTPATMIPRRNKIKSAPSCASAPMLSPEFPDVRIATIVRPLLERSPTVEIHTGRQFHPVGAVLTALSVPRPLKRVPRALAGRRRIWRDGIGRSRAVARAI